MDDVINDMRLQHEKKHQVFMGTEKPNSDKNFNIEMELKKREAVIKQMEEDYKKVIAYNMKVLELDPLYASFKVYNLHDVIVRLFLREPKQTGGLLLNGIDQIIVKTQNGQGVKERITNPFPFKKLGVVVNKCERNEALKIGDVVILPPTFSIAPIPGDSSTIEYQGFFAHYEYDEEFPPKDYMNPHFGYRKFTSPSDIIGIESNIFEQ